jgi:hypothetical protein
VKEIERERERERERDREREREQGLAMLPKLVKLLGSSDDLPASAF